LSFTKKKLEKFMEIGLVGEIFLSECHQPLESHVYNAKGGGIQKGKSTKFFWQIYP